MTHNDAIPISVTDLGVVLNCAVRYCMGRQTYMPSIVIDFITPLIPRLDNKTLWCLDRDLSDPAVYGGLGDEKIDAPLWIKFHERIKEEIKSRKEQENGN